MAANANNLGLTQRQVCFALLNGHELRREAGGRRRYILQHAETGRPFSASNSAFALDPAKVSTLQMRGLVDVRAGDKAVSPFQSEATHAVASRALRDVPREKL